MDKRGHNGGKSIRAGERFHKEVTKMIEDRLKDNKYSISTEKITDLIVRHDNWPNILEDILTITEEEIKVLWK